MPEMTSIKDAINILPSGINKQCFNRFYHVPAYHHGVSFVSLCSDNGINCTMGFRGNRPHYLIYVISTPETSERTYWIWKDDKWIKTTHTFKQRDKIVRPRYDRFE